MTVKITEIEQIGGAKLLLVEGKLTSSDMKTLAASLSERRSDENVAIDLSGVTFLDSEGATVLKELEQTGVELTGADLFIKAVIDTHNTGTK